jgi:hypothetical protein
MEMGQGEAVDSKEEGGNEIKNENLGLTTIETLDILQGDITRIIDEYEKDFKKNRFVKI